MTRTLMQWVPASRSAGRRATHRCEHELRLDPRFLGGLVAGEHLLDERIGRRSRFILTGARSPIWYSTVVRGPPSKTLTTTSVVPKLVLRDRRAEQLAHAESPSASLRGPREFAVENDAHLPCLRLLRGPEPCGGAVAVDAQDMEPVGVAVVAVRDRHAAVIVGTAPPRARHRRHHVMMMRRPSRIAIIAAQVVMLGRVGVARKADARAVAQKLERMRRNPPC